MTNAIDIFKNEFLGANTWVQRKDGVPLDLLDNLSSEELKAAEIELIRSLGSGDTWPIIGLGHIKSAKALPALYNLLENAKRAFKVTVACSIYQICQDPKMIEVVLEEMPRTRNQFELIHLIHLLPRFKDQRIKKLLNGYRQHKEYLVAYNATTALGLPTDEVVRKFQKGK